MTFQAMRAGLHASSRRVVVMNAPLRAAPRLPHLLLPATRFRDISHPRWLASHPPPRQPRYGEYQSPEFHKQQQERQRQQQQNRQDRQQHNEGEKEHKQPWPIQLAMALLGADLMTGTIWDIYILFIDDNGAGRYLNAATFTPHVVTAVEPVSSTAFILTVQPILKTYRFRAPILPNAAPPDLPAMTAEIYEDAWAHGLWAVEFKQPQLQIAREYTPLPPGITAGDFVGLDGNALDDASPAFISASTVQPNIERNPATELRFLIRTVNGGELSTYLSTLRPGDKVELRGPRTSFDVPARMGLGRIETPIIPWNWELERRPPSFSMPLLAELAWNSGGKDILQMIPHTHTYNQAQKERQRTQERERVNHALNATGAVRSVVVLAGGTGIASALQVVEAVLNNDPNGKSRVDILWANRNREDCIGCDSAGAQTERVSAFWAKSGGGQPASSSLAIQTLASQRAGPIISHIHRLQALHPDRLSLRCVVDAEGTFIDEPAVRARIAEANALNADVPIISNPNCHYHASAPLVISSSDAHPPSGRTDWTEVWKFKTVPPPKCLCRSPPPPGKNLVVVSGPEGFVNAWAGPKRWPGGRESQGDVTGALGEMARQDGNMMKDWLVVKL